MRLCPTYPKHVAAVSPARPGSKLADPKVASLLAVAGEERAEIPAGRYHTGLTEPWHITRASPPPHSTHGPLGAVHGAEVLGEGLCTCF